MSPCCWCKSGYHKAYHKEHFACFNCRKAYKWSYTTAGCLYYKAEMLEYYLRARKVVCPQCAKPMVAMGKNFKAPKQTNKKQWEKVRLLYQNGFAYHPSCCNTPQYRPRKLNEVAKFLEKNKKISVGEGLIKKWSKK